MHSLFNQECRGSQRGTGEGLRKSQDTPPPQKARGNERHHPREAGKKSPGIRPEEMASHTAKTTHCSTKVKVFKQVCAHEKKQEAKGRGLRKSKQNTSPDQWGTGTGRKGEEGRGRGGEREKRKRGKNSGVTLKSSNF